MKALEKDRDRRYETANGLAADVQRYLADEPVRGAAAERRLPAAEVRAAEQGAGDRGGPGAAGAGGRDRRDDAGAGRRADAEGKAAAATDAERKAKDAGGGAASRGGAGGGGGGQRPRRRRSGGWRRSRRATRSWARSSTTWTRRRARRRASRWQALLGERLDQATGAAGGRGDRRPAGRGADADDAGGVAARPGLRGEGDRAVHEGTADRTLRGSAPTTPTRSPSMNNLASGLPGRRQARPGPAALRGDAQAQEGEARPRPPRHAHQHEQPRRGLPARRQARPGPAAARGDARAAEGEARPRPPRHARQHEQPRRGLPGRREARPGPAAPARRRWSSGRRSSAPTTPTRSPA